ncbi:hypothetical protein GCM10007905_15490 [Mixta theicola]|nr:hypothetical protein GCM10007905_15490 [Mixta theicola]
MLLKNSERRENAHFFDGPHSFNVRYFSFMRVNDKFTTALQLFGRFNGMKTTIDKI